ncbi:MAG: hypothetical protein HY791_30125 [Deltaproteobacteria bacterium]|nr:hypothetical protein [Deltaproteobacteria bacterium]
MRARIALALASVAVPVVAGATVMLPLSIEDMSKEALAVVRARVLQREADWDARHSRIYTHTRLEVLDTIHARASLPKELLVRTLGGEVGEVGMKVAGTPIFADGEEVVVFLRADPEVATEYQVIGMAQGKLHVRRTAKGLAMVVPSLEGLAFVRPDQNGTLKATEEGPSDAEMALGVFEGRVKKAVESAPSPTAPALPALPAPPSITPAAR